MLHSGGVEAIVKGCNPYLHVREITLVSEEQELEALVAALRDILERGELAQQKVIAMHSG
jgi:hypothetical protein